MCGIVGVVNGQRVASILIGGLQKLGYRGYDSAGLATINGGKIEFRRTKGKLENLENLLAREPLDGKIGIAHTRWATHGAPTAVNAHPHVTDKVAVVHNGIIENFKELREELQALGHDFASDTDTEVIPHLISHYMESGLSPVEATAETLKRLDGAYALGILFQGCDDQLIAARRGSPLVIGHGEDAMYLASDALALSAFTREITYLEDGDLVVLRQDGVEIRDEAGQRVNRPVRHSKFDSTEVGKGSYRHFMLKEIFEQPVVIRRTMGNYYDAETSRIRIPHLPFDFSGLPRLTIVACGTSSYAGQVAKYWFEKYAALPVEVDIASEFRYRDAPFPEGGAALFISQSGETADTLAAMRHAHAHGQHTVALVNVPESSMAREADVVLHTLAGQEIGVASTKAFTTQLTALACLAIAAGRARQSLSRDKAEEITTALSQVPTMIERILEGEDRFQKIAKDISKAPSVLFMGRGTSFPIALEGALKLKEISYIHAEGYGAGELKHGPIALVEESVPVVVLAPSDGLFDKTISNLQEVKARDGRIILISDAKGLSIAGQDIAAAIEIPQAHPFVTPILYSVPVQLLAYHVALQKGTDVDQPRNLAKSVTVE